MTLFTHGVYHREEHSALIAVIRTETALPIVVGTAPVHTLATQSVNELVKLESWADVEATFGYVHDFGRYTLMEFLYNWFRLAGFSPVLCVNTFDPADVSAAASATAVDLELGIGTLEVEGALVVAVTQDAEGLTVYEEGEDYTLTYNTAGNPVITRLADGDIPAVDSTVYVSHRVIPADKAGVDASAIVSGLDELDKAFVQFGDIPSLICCPGYSQDPEVMAAMVAKTTYGGGWCAYALCDADCSSTAADDVTEVAAWKGTNGYTDENMDVLWPKVKVGDDEFYLSTVFAGILARTDQENGNVPFDGGSNKSMQISGAVTEAGDAVYITDAQANDDLNANGITTVISLGSIGWKSWGNRTAAYPGTSDPKDMWRAYRRMLVWLKNTTRLTLLQKVDQPGNFRQIESIVNSLNIFLNGLAAQGALVGEATVEFRREDNSDTDLIDGKYTIRISLCPPTPMETITEVWQIDVSQLSTLFTGGA